MKPVFVSLFAGTLAAVVVTSGAAWAACEKPLADVFAAVAPSVVSVFAVTVDPFSLTERVVPHLGSGVVIDDQKRVLTNAHVAYGSSFLSVTTGDGGMHEARLVGADPITDLAVLEMSDAPSDLRPAQLGDSDALRIGEDVMAIGNPFGLGPTASGGIVSAVGRVVPLSPMSWLSPLIQTDAAINPGNSGGPLVDRCGAVVAINTLQIAAGENIGFAVPINLARDVAAQLVENKRVIRPWHGVGGKVVDVRLQMLLGVPFIQGFLIETIEPGSPAETIGLKGGNFPVMLGPEEYLLGGDIITNINGEALADMDTVIRIVTSLRVGDELKLSYLRDGEIHHAEVTLPERPILPGDLLWRRQRRR